MVHIGAMAGAALSQGHSTSLGFSTGLFRRFQNPKDKRDFVTAGTAVGIAVSQPLAYSCSILIRSTHAPGFLSQGQARLCDRWRRRRRRGIPALGLQLQ